MPDQHPAGSHPAPIRTPDQLQQAKREDRPRPTAAPAPQPDAPEASATGVLGQLATERAHD